MGGFSGVGEPPDPQDESTFLRSKVNPTLAREGSHKILFDYYKALINLRKKIPSLSHLSKAGLRVEALAEKPCLWILRRYEEQRVWCLFNFSPQPQRVIIPVDEEGLVESF